MPKRAEQARPRAAPARAGPLSAGVIVVRCHERRWRVLLLRAYRYWDFPKGLVEPGESPLAAARREVREETGLAELELRWGEACYETAPYRGGKIARYHLAHSPAGEVILGASPALGRPEHHAHGWLDYPAAADLLVPRVRAALDWARGITGEGC